MYHRLVGRTDRYSLYGFHTGSTLLPGNTAAAGRMAAGFTGTVFCSGESGADSGCR